MRPYEQHRVVVGDAEGIRHDSIVTITRRGVITDFTVRTACAPTGGSQRLTHGYWKLTNLPTIVLGRPGVRMIHLITYHVREAVTCLECAATPKVFYVDRV